MPRPRNPSPLDLPKRVTFKHGAFYYRHRDGRWERLGTDHAEACRRGNHVNDPQSLYGSMAWYFEQFILWCEGRVKAGKLSQRTLDDYRENIVPLKEYAGHLLPAQVTPPIVQKYLDIGVECSRPVRANREKACWSMCMTWIRTRRPEAALMVNPCYGVKRNTEKERDRYVEDAEYTAVKKFATKMAKAYAELVYRTLQRPSDVLTWTRNNIRTKALPDGRNLTVLKFTQSKTGQELEIEVDAHLASVIESVKRNVIGIPLIHTAKGKAYTEEGIASMWRRWCGPKKANVQSFGVMDLRGKGATDMYAAGVPLERIQVLMGHESVTTTEIYVKRLLKTVVTPNQVGLNV